MHMLFGNFINLQSNIVSLFALTFIVCVPVPVMGYTPVQETLDATLLLISARFDSSANKSNCCF